MATEAQRLRGKANRLRQMAPTDGWAGWWSSGIAARCHAEAAQLDAQADALEAREAAAALTDMQRTRNEVRQWAAQCLEAERAKLRLQTPRQPERIGNHAARRNALR